MANRVNVLASDLRERADKSAVGTINRPLRFNRKDVELVNSLCGSYSLKRAILTATGPICKRDNRASDVNAVIYHSYDDIRVENGPISLETIYKQELSIISSYSSSPEDLRIARDLLASRKVRIDGLISHRLPLEQFHEGVALMRERAALKVYFQIAGGC